MATRPWLPTDATPANLKEWLYLRDATGATANGARYSSSSNTWSDASGGSRDVGPAGGTAPTYDSTNNELVFSNGALLRTAANYPISGAAARHFYVVGRRVSSSLDAYAFFLGSENGANAFSLDLSNPNSQQVVAFTWGGGPNDISLGAASDALRLVGMAYDGSVLSGALDGGTATTSTTTLSTTASPLTIGRRPGDGGAFRLKEIVGYDAKLSSSDEQKLQGYLAWNNGTQGSLPANHPYKAAAPTVNTGGGTDATALGSTVSSSGSLIPGSATGQSNATASGTTLSAAGSLIPGTASAAGNATASGTTLSAVSSLIAGAATGAVNGTATGATLTAAASLVSGAASGTKSATALGAILTATGAFVPGSASASASGNVTATGATVPASAVLVAGSASATANVTASGGTFASAALFIPGTATGASNGTAAGVTLSAGPILLPGAATAGRGATATGAIFTVVSAFVPGSASASVNPYPPITPDVLLSGTLLGPVSLQARLQANTITLQARLRR